MGSEAKSLGSSGRECVFSGPRGQMPGWRGPGIPCEGVNSPEYCVCKCFTAPVFHEGVTLRTALTATAAAAVATAARRGGRLLQVGPSFSEAPLAPAQNARRARGFSRRALDQREQMLSGC